jgi:hypothetical protein
MSRGMKKLRTHSGKPKPPKPWDSLGIPAGTLVVRPLLVVLRQNYPAELTALATARPQLQSRPGFVLIVSIPQSIALFQERPVYSQRLKCVELL